MNKQESICLLQWNCRSITRNLPYLLQHLTDQRYQILILQSLNVDRNNVPNIPGYYYPPIRQTNCIKVYTCIYIEKGLEYTFCKSPIPATITNIYHTTVRVKLSNSRIINVMSLYLPTGPTDLNTDWLKSIELSNDNWIIAGDMNSHSPLWEKGCTLVTNKRLVENILDSSLTLLNDGSITRIPDNGLTLV